MRFIMPNLKDPLYASLRMLYHVWKLERRLNELSKVSLFNSCALCNDLLWSRNCLALRICHIRYLECYKNPFDLWENQFGLESQLTKSLVREYNVKIIGVWLALEGFCRTPSISMSFSKLATLACQTSKFPWKLGMNRCFNGIKPQHCYAIFIFSTIAKLWPFNQLWNMVEWLCSCMFVGF